MIYKSRRKLIRIDKPEIGGRVRLHIGDAVYQFVLQNTSNLALLKLEFERHGLGSVGYVFMRRRGNHFLHRRLVRIRVLHQLQQSLNAVDDLGKIRRLRERESVVGNLHFTERLIIEHSPENLKVEISFWSVFGPFLVRFVPILNHFFPF